MEPICVRSSISKTAVEEFKEKFCELLLDLKYALCSHVNSSNHMYTVKDMMIQLRGAIKCDTSDLSIFSTNKKLQKAEFIEEVFEVLSNKCSLYDYELLRLFVKTTQCEEAAKILRDFSTELEQTLLKKLNLMCEYATFKSRNLPFDENRKLTIKCENKYMNITIEDERLIRNKLCALFKLPSHRLLLVDVTKGCIALIYEISQEVKEHLLQCKIQITEKPLVERFTITQLIIDDEFELNITGDKVHIYVHT